MTINTSRRNFLLGSTAGLVVSGCRNLNFFANPDLRFGVLSDIHLREPESGELFEHTLEYLRDQKVDAVVISGDLTDWGLRGQFFDFKAIWDRVMNGTAVVPLFCTGNHDFEGWCYGDMTMEMHVMGYSESDRIVKFGMKKCWEEAFGEKYDEVRLRTVKGFDFICSEYGSHAKVPAFLKANAARLHAHRPFFYFQHTPILGTTPDSQDGSEDKGVLKSALSSFPNCVSFAGHCHRPFNDERNIWQEGFTAIAVPSLSYAATPGGYENGYNSRNGTAENAMPFPPDRLNLRGGQGYIVEVSGAEMCVRRIDFEENCVEGAAPWVVPLPFSASAKPYRVDTRTAASLAPVFPKGAAVKAYTRNTENRKGEWTIVAMMDFPSAKCPDGLRIYDYEVRAVALDGSETLTKRFLTPSYSRLEKYEPNHQRFYLDVKQLPQAKPYRFEVRARNCYGKASAPILSRVWRAEPGLGKSNREL